MPHPIAYEPQQGQMYHILTRYQNQPYEHCDYAVDKVERDYLLKNYREAYSNDFRFKTILLPKKYHNKK